MKNSTQTKIWPTDLLDQKVNEVKSAGKSIVFTNGVFDILHAGHVHYLEQTAQLGDFFIVALNSDESVQRLDKSPARPLQSEQSRAAVMASLGCVDAVVIFSEDTPKEIIEQITPNVLVKGGDYQLHQIAGADWVKQHGGTVTTIEFLPGFSTTQIEQKIIQTFHNT